MKPKRTTKRKSAILPAAVCEQELYDRLTEFAEKEGISRSEVIREALNFYLNRASRRRQQVVSHSETDTSKKGKSGE